MRKTRSIWSSLKKVGVPPPSGVGQAGVFRLNAGQAAPFLFKVFDIGIGAALVFGNDFIAAAVVADGIAKGDVNVKGERFI